MKKRLGEILLERKLIDMDQLNAALAHHRQWGMRLGQAMIAKGFVAEGVLIRVLAESLGIPMVDLSRAVVDAKALALVPRKLAEEHDVFPVGLQAQANGRRVLLLAMADPLNATAIDEIAFTTDCIVRPAIAQGSSIDQAIRKHYYHQSIEVDPFMMEKSVADMVAPESITMLNAQGEEHQHVLGSSVGASSAAQPTTGEMEGTVPSYSASPPAPSPFAAGSNPYLSWGTMPPGPLSSSMTGQPTGVFSMPPQSMSGEGLPLTTGKLMRAARVADPNSVEELEKRFWALMRLLTRRGVVTKEEFLTELRQGENF